MKTKINMENSAKKHNEESRKKTKKSMPFFCRIIIIMMTIIACLWLYILLVQWPITEEEYQEAEIAFSLDIVYDDTMEVGESKIEQEGQYGREKNIWKIEKKGLLTKKEISRKYDRTERLEAPVNKIERRGTRKWQYMICSNGNYRYYTDEQFADPNVGFTHSSEDSCAKNNQGVMIELSDTPPTRNNTNNYNSNNNSTYIPRPSYVPGYISSNSAPPDSTAQYNSPDLNQWSPSGSTDINVSEGLDKWCGFIGNEYVCK